MSSSHTESEAELSKAVDQPIGERFGPYYAILNRNGNLRVNEVGDPYVFLKMGPHDNHTKHGRKIVRVMIDVLTDEDVSK